MERMYESHKNSHFLFMLAKFALAIDEMMPQVRQPNLPPMSITRVHLRTGNHRVFECGRHFKAYEAQEHVMLLVISKAIPCNWSDECHFNSRH